MSERHNLLRMDDDAETGFRSEFGTVGMPSLPPATPRINHEREIYPYCIVWTPLPMISWFLPFIGMILPNCHDFFGHLIQLVIRICQVIPELEIVEALFTTLRDLITLVLATWHFRSRPNTCSLILPNASQRIGMMDWKKVVIAIVNECITFAAITAILTWRSAWTLWPTVSFFQVLALFHVQLL